VCVCVCVCVCLYACVCVCVCVSICLLLPSAAEDPGSESARVRDCTPLCVSVCDYLYRIGVCVSVCELVAT